MAVSSSGQKMAVAVNEKGKRNIYTATEGSAALQKVTDYREDDGQELTSITITEDGKWIVYVRGGDHGAFNRSIPRNPASLVEKPAIKLYSIPFAGGKPVLLAEGDYPVIRPGGKEVAFLKNNQVFIVPVDGSTTAKPLFYDLGKSSALEWSPDGNRLLFVSSRGTHSFIGIYHAGKTAIQWIAPSAARDLSPRWSPNGKEVVFVRRAAAGGKTDSATVRKPVPWSVWKADVATGAATRLWSSPRTDMGSVPSSTGGFNLHWAHNRIVFLSYQDGWPHLYSIPESGGEALLLTPGNFVVEDIRLSPDRKHLAFACNALEPDDKDRRHIGYVSVDKADMKLLTHGHGIESNPVFTGDGKELYMFSATSITPTLPAKFSFMDGGIRHYGKELIPSDFPKNQLVIPTHISFPAPDGQPVYGQLFLPKIKKTKAPAILFVHGGPRRQMLTGWHYMDYYANTYAINQYLASQGYVVLSVNYRLGTGYGYTFQHPKYTEKYGASEYQDIRAAGQWLAAREDVDPQRIGIYGGSYGGFLTALALGKDSDLFAAGVDISGMHNFMDELPGAFHGEEAPDLDTARSLAWEASPVAHLDTWTSPVLLISGDDDGNVEYYETLDLIRRFEENGFEYESLVVPDETHHWMKYQNLLLMNNATVDFIDRKVKNKTVSGPLAGKVICVDPGHGGTAHTDHYRQGVGGEREEWINLRVAKILAAELRKRGASVVLTRQEDVFVPLADRAKLAVQKEADLFISIHHNATADTSVNFPVIYFHGAASENEAGVALAREVSASLKNEFYHQSVPESIYSDYTIFPGGGAAVLRQTYGIPAILSEASFFSNPSEEQRLMESAHNRKEAIALANAITTFLSRPIPPVKAKVIPTELPAFKVYEEADRMQEAALQWKSDFEQAEELMNSRRKKDLRKAYELFTVLPGLFRIPTWLIKLMKTGCICYIN